MRVWGLVFGTSIIGCNSTTKIEEDTSTVQGPSDADGDGFFSDEDCDDADMQINPGAEEICDGIDNNCNGDTDEGVLVEFYADSDDDGYGNPSITMEA